MPEQIESGFSPVALSSEMFDKLSAVIHQRAGISLGKSKNLMLQSRLQKRLRATDVRSFEAYYRLLKDENNREFAAFINAVTTNKTEFYREPHHFEVLVDAVDTLLSVPTDEQNVASNGLQLWSAGCSTGEEAYTVAMALAEKLGTRAGKYAILATDIDTRVLAAGKKAVYTNSEVRLLPLSWQRKYLLRGVKKYNGYYRIVPELRDKVQFKQLNFAKPRFDVPYSLDIIFCRNVMIYFRPDMRARLIHAFDNHLRPGGYLFVGHSESLAGLDTDFQTIAPTVYRKPMTPTRSRLSSE